MTTCFNFIRRTASATRCGSSASSANGFAVVTAQNPQARVQRSPAIMNVAVPLLQHSKWFGHRALSHTVCSFNSSSRERVRANLSVVGNRMRSHSGRRGRAGASAGFNAGILLLFQLLPKTRELIGAKIGENLPIHIDDRCKFLSRE